VYLKGGGGLRMGDRAAHLAGAAALVSPLAIARLPPDAVYFGEVSPSGAVRRVAQAAARLKEAAKLGFARAVLPQGGTEASAEAGLALEAVTSLSTLVADIAARGRGTRNSSPRNAPREAGRGLG